MSVNACGEIPAQSSVYLDWYFHPLEKKAYDLALSVKYYPTPIDLDFGDFGRQDDQGNIGDREGDNRSVYGNENRLDDRRVERDGGREEEGGGEEKGGSAFTSFTTGHHHSIYYLFYFSVFIIHFLFFYFILCCYC